MDTAAVETFKKSPIADWDFGAGELIKTGYDIIKVRVIRVGHQQ